MKDATMTTMKANVRKLLALLAAMLLTLTVASGCSSESTASNTDGNTDNASAETQSAAPAEEVAITVTVTGEHDGIEINETTDMSVQAGITALDALQLVCSDVVIEDGDYGPFVTSVNGLANEGTSGWIYTINYDYVPESADAYTLADGDIVTWSYYIG